MDISWLEWVISVLTHLWPSTNLFLIINGCCYESESGTNDCIAKEVIGEGLIVDYHFARGQLLLVLIQHHSFDKEILAEFVSKDDLKIREAIRVNFLVENVELTIFIYVEWHNKLSFIPCYIRNLLETILSSLSSIVCNIKVSSR